MVSALTYHTTEKVEPFPVEPFDREWGVGISGNTPEPSPFPRINRILSKTAKTTNGFVAPDRAVLVTEAYKMGEAEHFLSPELAERRAVRAATGAICAVGHRALAAVV